MIFKKCHQLGFSVSLQNPHVAPTQTIVWLEMDMNSWCGMFHHSSDNWCRAWWKVEWALITKTFTWRECKSLTGFLSCANKVDWCISSAHLKEFDMFLLLTRTDFCSLHFFIHCSVSWWVVPSSQYQCSGFFLLFNCFMTTRTLVAGCVTVVR